MDARKQKKKFTRHTYDKIPIACRINTILQ